MKEREREEGGRERITLAFQKFLWQKEVRHGGRRKSRKYCFCNDWQEYAVKNKDHIFEHLFSFV